MVIYRDIVLSTVALSTIGIDLNSERSFNFNGMMELNSERSFNFNGMMELLNQPTVHSARVLLEIAMLIYMLVNGKLLDQELKIPQVQG